jgi:IS1 family transposase
MGKLQSLSVCSFVTDHWKSYAKFIPPNQHFQSKSEMCTVESYNSRIRHDLARFKRKKKCYSKSEEMIEISLKILLEKLNNKKSMPN